MANIYKTSADNDSGSLNYHIQAYALAQGLGRLKSDLVLAKLVTNYTSDAKNQGSRFGSNVRVPKRGTSSVGTKTPGTAVTYTAATSTKADIAVNQHKTIDRLIEDYGLLFAQEDLLAGYVMDAVDAHAEGIDSAIAALYASAGATSGTAGSTADDAWVRTIRQAARSSTHKFNMAQPMYLVVGNTTEKDLLGDALFVQADQSGSTEALVNAKLGKKFGFEVYTSNLIASVAGTAGGEHNLAFQRDAIGIAFVDMNVDSIPGAFTGNVDMQTMMLPDDDGVPAYSLRVILGYDQKERGVAMSVDTIYGVGVVRSEHLIDCLS